MPSRVRLFLVYKLWVVKNAPGAGGGHKGLGAAPAVPCKGKAWPVADTTHAFIPSHLGQKLESQGESNRAGEAFRPLVPAIQSVLCAVLSRPGFPGPTGVSVVPVPSSPSPSRHRMGAAGCWQEMPSRDTHLVAAASQEKRRSELTALLLPPAPHSPGVPEQVLPQPPLSNTELLLQGLLRLPRGPDASVSVRPSCRARSARVPSGAAARQAGPGVGQLRTASAPPVPAQPRRSRNGQSRAEAGRERREGWEEGGESSSGSEA